MVYVFFDPRSKLTGNHWIERSQISFEMREVNADNLELVSIVHRLNALIILSSLINPIDCLP